MKQLQIPFQEKLHPFNQEDFSDFSPTALVPCLYDEDTVVWESLAIVEYLADKHPQVWPQDRSARNWARCATAEMHAGFNHLRNDCSMSCGVRLRLHQQSAGLLKDLDRLQNLWTEGLEKFGGPFLAGKNFTAVDAFYAPVAFRIQTFDLPLNQKAEGYVNHLLALPAMQQWYQEALAEPWRDHPHDEDLYQHVDIIEDLRKPL